MLWAAANVDPEAPVPPAGEADVGVGRPVEADLERVVKILRDAGYRGYLVLEYEAAEDPMEAIPRHLDKLRRILGR